MMTLSRNRTEKRDFAVILVTQETDEEGIPWERRIGVQIDAGVTPQWDEWLTCFNQNEGRTYFIQEITEVTEVVEVGGYRCLSCGGWVVVDECGVGCCGSCCFCDF